MNNDDAAPAWANALLQRLQAVEQQLATTANTNNDPNVTVRNPGANFHPTEEMLAQYPFIQEDFFKRPLDDSQRRQFLFDCPKNAIRNYDPPKLNKVTISASAKHFDSALHNIQYRLSGLTRPLDWFLYQNLHGNINDTNIRQQGSDFAQAMHGLLSDLASYITTLRTDNLYKGLPNHLEAPSSQQEKFLVNTQDMLDHIKLQQSIQLATQRRSKKNKGPRSYTYQKQDYEKPAIEQAQRRSADNYNQHQSSSFTTINNGGSRPYQQSQQRDFHPRQSHQRTQ